ncbi:MAG: NAD(P)-dependent oxidoreductase [Candidatus Margulisbacteria bacterium]|jgi:nucleoside-diphosphate-sugar epimerase|nr:NAD(P)-dependent oxidoreductase [Candidatus Margulisiibacteriota bacterium]
MTAQNILITGISGSVGHYLFDLLANDSRYHLYLVLRDPARLRRDLKQFSNVTVLPLDLRDLHRQKDLLQKMDYLVWIATCWGGYREPWRVNVYPFFRTLRRLDPQRIKKILYFSTASIIDREHRPIEAIREIGTNYIRSKFLTHKILQYNKLRDKIITIFPTGVYGGDSTHPFSHAATGLRPAAKRIRWLKYFTLDFSFHFIHCADIARLTKYLLENAVDEHEYVFGNAPLNVGEFLKQIAACYGQKPLFQIPVPMPIIQFLAGLLKKHPWDKYCLRYKHFIYNTINCHKLGLPTEVDTVSGLIKAINQ